MSQPSFDLDINGIKFTLAPICADEGECNQYSVMTNEHIFRMLYDETSESYRIAKESNIPVEIGDLEEYLSNAIISSEKTG